MAGPVIFFVLLVFPGMPPMQFAYSVNNLSECLFEVHEFMVKPSHELLIKGGHLRVGCARDFPPSQEH